MHVVYIDTLFFVNFIVNDLILCCTGKICSQNALRYRRVLSGLFGSTYAVLAVFPRFAFLHTPWIKFGIGLLMVLIAFGSARRIWKVILVFFAVSLMFGGAVVAILLLEGGDLHAGYYGIPVTLRILLISFGISYCLLSLVFRHAVGVKQGGGSVSVTVSRNGRTQQVTALLDTGNMLTDPFTGRKIILVDWDVLLPLFSEAEQTVLQRLPGEDPSTIYEVLAGVSTDTRYRLIPYHTVGTKSGLLLAFCPEHLVVKRRQVADVMLAFSPTKLSEDGNYQGIMGVGII